jgi:glycosyltransferase involved in cell wall biosynthesis
MADEYSRRYGRTWSWFTTLIAAEAYDPAPRTADGTIRLVYAGSLELARWESLRTIALALKQLRDKQGIQTRLIIYAAPDQLNEHRAALDVPPVTDLRGWVAPEHLPQVFHDADVLVHAESFQPALTDYTKLSFSTKLSQYMMAGRCILAFGPENLGSIRVARDAGAAVAFSENSPAALARGLYPLLTRPEMRQQLARSGRLWAEQNVDHQAAKERFRQELVAALQRSRGQKRPSAAA